MGLCWGALGALLGVSWGPLWGLGVLLGAILEAGTQVTRAGHQCAVGSSTRESMRRKEVGGGMRRQKEAGRRQKEAGEIQLGSVAASSRIGTALERLVGMLESILNNREPSRAVCCQHPETTPRAIVGPSWRLLGPSWGSLRALSGRSWGSLGAILEAIDQKKGVDYFSPPVGAIKSAS